MRRKNLGSAKVKKAISLAMAFMMGISVFMSTSSTVNAFEGTEIVAAVETEVEAVPTMADVKADIVDAVEAESEVAKTLFVGDVKTEEILAIVESEAAKELIEEAEATDSNAKAQTGASIEAAEKKLEEVDEKLEAAKDYVRNEGEAGEDAGFVVESKLDEAQQELVDAIDHATDALENGFATSKDAQDEYDALSGSYNKANAQYQESAKELEDAYQALCDAQVAYEKAKGLSDGQAEVAYAQLVAAKTRLDNAVTATKTAKDRVDSIDNLLDQISGKLTSSSESLEDKKAAIDAEFEKNKEELDKTVEELKESGSNAADKLKNFGTELSELKASIDKLYSSIQNAKAEKAELEALYKQYEDAVKAYEAAVKAIEDAGYNTSVADYDLEQAKADIAELKNTMDAAETAKDEAAEAYKEYESSTYGDDITTLKNNIEEATKQGDAEALADYQKQLAQLVFDHEVKGDRTVVDDEHLSEYGSFDESIENKWVVLDENGKPHAYTYKYENGVLSIYELKGVNDTEYVVLDNGTQSKIETVSTNGNTYRYYVNADGKCVALDANNSEMTITLDKYWYKNEWWVDTYLNATNVKVYYDVVNNRYYIDHEDVQWTNIASHGTVGEDLYLIIREGKLVVTSDKYTGQTDGVSLVSGTALNTAYNMADTKYSLETDKTAETTSEKYLTDKNNAYQATVETANAYTASKDAYEAKVEEYNTYKTAKDAEAALAKVDLGKLADLPVDVKDFVLKADINSAEDAKKLGDALGKLAGNGSAVEKAAAFAEVASILGINPVDDAEMWAALTYAYYWNPEVADSIETKAQNAIEAYKNSVVYKALPDKYKEASVKKMEEDAKKLAGLDDEAIRFKHEYAVQWIDLMKARVEVVKAGFAVVNQTADTVDAGKELIIAAADVNDKAVKVALQGLKTAILAGTSSALEISTKSLDLANKLVVALDNKVEKLQEQTDDAYDKAVKAQSDLDELMKNYKPANQDEIDALKADLDNKWAEYNELNGQLHGVKNEDGEIIEEGLEQELENAKNLLDKIAKEKKALEEAEEAAKKSGGNGGNGGQPRDNEGNGGQPVDDTDLNGPLGVDYALTHIMEDDAPAARPAVRIVRGNNANAVAAEDEVEIQDEDTPLAAEETTINDSEVPLAVEDEMSLYRIWWLLIIAIIAGSGTAAYIIRKKKKAEAVETEEK